jgi:hypothetical protein
MANLTADDIKRIEQALTKNRRDLNVVDRIVNLINNDTGVAGVTYTISAEGVPGADEITVSCQFTDANGNDMATYCGVRQYLATDATGQVGEAAATTLAVGTDGTILVEETSNLIWTAVSEIDGDLDIVIGNAGGADDLYLVTILPNGKLAISSVIAFGA